MIRRTACATRVVNHGTKKCIVERQCLGKKLLIGRMVRGFRYERAPFPEVSNQASRLSYKEHLLANLDEKSRDRRWTAYTKTLGPTCAG